MQSRSWGLSLAAIIAGPGRKRERGLRRASKTQHNSDVKAQCISDGKAKGLKGKATVPRCRGVLSTRAASRISDALNSEATHSSEPCEEAGLPPRLTPSVGVADDAGFSAPGGLKTKAPMLELEGVRLRVQEPAQQAFGF